MAYPQDPAIPVEVPRWYSKHADKNPEGVTIWMRLIDEIREDMNKLDAEYGKPIEIAQISHSIDQSGHYLTAMVVFRFKADA